MTKGVPRPGIRYAATPPTGGSDDLGAVHLAERVGDELQPGSVGVPEVQRRPADVLVVDAGGVQALPSGGPGLLRHRDRQVVEAAEDLRVGSEVEAREVEEGDRVAVADVEEEVCRA